MYHSNCMKPLARNKIVAKEVWKWGGEEGEMGRGGGGNGEGGGGNGEGGGEMGRGGGREIGTRTSGRVHSNGREVGGDS